MSIPRITTTGPMLKQINRGLMVNWINSDLVNRASNDIRKSTVFYDADQMFVAALPAGIDLPESAWDTLERETGVRYWSTGLV